MRMSQLKQVSRMRHNLNEAFEATRKFYTKNKINFKLICRCNKSQWLCK